MADLSGAAWEQTSTCANPVQSCRWVETLSTSWRPISQWTHASRSLQSGPLWNQRPQLCRRAISDRPMRRDSPELLRRPLSRSRALAAEEVCRDYIAPLLGTNPANPDLLPLSIHEQAQVFRVSWRHHSFAVKIHSSPAALVREHMALKMFGKCRVSPRLLWRPSEKHLALAMEYLPTPLRFGAEGALGCAASTLAAAHEVASRCFRSLPASLQRDLVRQAAERNGERSNRRRAEGELASLIDDAFMSCCIGDVKRDHFRSDVLGPRIIDLETFCWGGSILIDIQRLIDCASVENMTAEPSDEVCRAYVARRRALSPSWPISSTQLAAFVRCLG